MQIKCLLELNCVCPVPFNSARAFVTLGSRWWKVPNTYTVKGLLRKVPDAKSCGSGTKREKISCGALFFNGRYVTPRGCCWWVKQDHQFLTKISTIDPSFSCSLLFWMLYFGQNFFNKIEFQNEKIKNWFKIQNAESLEIWKSCQNGHLI